MVMVAVVVALLVVYSESGQHVCSVDTRMAKVDLYLATTGLV